MPQTVIHLSDLKKFNEELLNEKTEKSKVLFILQKLNLWHPVKDYIIISNIGKSIFKYSKAPGEIGLKATAIVNKWKKLIFPNAKETNQKVEILKHTSLSNSELKIKSGCTKAKNISRKSPMKEVPPKKVCLSLDDYYKRKGISNSNTKQDLGSSSQFVEMNDASEITSDLGISFMESLSIKPYLPVRPKKSKLLKTSEISAMVSADCISRRTDIIQTPEIKAETIATKKDDINTDDNITGQFQTQLKIWVPKRRQQCLYSNGSEVLSLMKLCQDVLFTYREYIEEVFDTPRELLVDILESFTCTQLLRFESFNPHYIEDNDGLWEKICLSKFPNVPKLSHDTWRNTFKFAEAKELNKFDDCVKNMKRKNEELQKFDLKHSTKFLSYTPRIANKRPYFYRDNSASLYSKPMQKIRNQCKSQFSHLRF